MSNIHQAQSHDILRSWQSQRHDINHHKDFVLPLFIINDDDSIESIESMPGVNRYGCNRVLEYLEPLVFSFGLRAVLLFPVIDKSEQVKIGLNVSIDGEGDSERDISSSPTSSASSSTSSSSTSTLSDEDEEHISVPPELLLPVDDPTMATNSQNPFLNQNEEEEDHLLGELKDRAREGEAEIRAPTPAPRLDRSLRIASRALDVKLIKKVALKDQYNPVLRLIPKLRAKFQELLIICDVCLCAFTSSGHCCLFEDHTKSRRNSLEFHKHHLNRTPTLNTNNLNDLPIANKLSCQYLAILSVEYASRGCQVIAPSDMMDGRVSTIRQLLNENKLQHVSILSYSAKFASSFYGPFRQAANSAPEFGDRRAYQLPPGSRTLALKAVKRDIEQGADFVMVKPAGPYLDIVRDIQERHPDVPIAIYQVSGEYSMLRMAEKAGLLNLKQAVNEMITSFRRAGATIIISYFTPELLRGEL